MFLTSNVSVQMFPFKCLSVLQYRGLFSTLGNNDLVLGLVKNVVKCLFPYKTCLTIGKALSLVYEEDESSWRKVKDAAGPSQGRRPFTDSGGFLAH